MTVYVDTCDLGLLMSDQIDPGELHEFAARIGVASSAFRPGRDNPWGAAAVRDYYDVTEPERAAAIAAGAGLLDGDGLRDLFDRRSVAACRAATSKADARAGLLATREGTRDELCRADQKAATLLALVSAVLVGIVVLTGRDLPGAAVVLLWASAASVAASAGLRIARTTYQRIAAAFTLLAVGLVALVSALAVAAVIGAAVIGAAA